MMCLSDIYLKTTKDLEYKSAWQLSINIPVSGLIPRYNAYITYTVTKRKKAGMLPCKLVHVSKYLVYGFYTKDNFRHVNCWEKSTRQKIGRGTTETGSLGKAMFHTFVVLSRREDIAPKRL